MNSKPHNDAEPQPASRAQVVAAYKDTVSRETWGRLDVYVALLLERQKTTNLIATSTIPDLWNRHIADSLQILKIAPTAQRWVDLGSGGGLPGIVVACALADRAGSDVHLVESRRKKASFLREVIHAAGLPAHVHAMRIEDFADKSRRAFDVVTARALAPLDLLLRYASPLLKKGALGVFPKGQDVAAELTQAAKSWTIEAELVPSLTDRNGRIVIVRRAEKRQPL